MKEDLICILKAIGLILLIGSAGFGLDGIIYIGENINGNEPWPWLFSIIAIGVDCCIVAMFAIGLFFYLFEKLTK